MSTKTIVITITHDLSPMHEETLHNTIHDVMMGMSVYWKANSVKKFNIKIDR